MKRGHIKVNYWDWRAWSFFGFIAVGVFWIFLFTSYYYAPMPDSVPVPPLCQTLINLIGAQEIVKYFYWEIAGAVFTLFLFGWFIFKQFNQFFNRHSLGSAVDDLLMAIPASYDEIIIESCQKLGIEISYDSTVIAPEVLQSASPDALAKTLSWLLYFKYDGIERLARCGQHTALHQLADLLLENWDEVDITDFVQALAEEKEYLGLALEAALNRRKLELRVAELERRIEQCREQENGVGQDLPIIMELEKRLTDYQELLSGKSAAVKWLKRCPGKLKSRLARTKQRSLNLM